MTRVWSPSSIWSYETCPRQWMILHREPGSGRRATIAAAPTSPGMLLGTVDHVGMEAAYRTAKLGFGPPGPQSMAVYSEAAIGAVRRACGEFGIDGQLEAEQAEAEVFAVLHQLSRPLPAAILGVEQRIDFAFDGVPFTSVLDLVLRTGARSLHIRDWKRKSIRKLPLTSALPENPQLCSYRVAVAERYPWATRVTGGLYSMISNREVSADLSLARAREVMAGQVAITRKAEEDTLCTPTPDGENCGSCRAKPLCPVWTAAGQA